MEEPKERALVATEAIRGSRREGTIRGDKNVLFVSGAEKEMAVRIAQRSGLSLAGLVRALIHLHANDTIHVKQTIEVQTDVSVEGKQEG